MPDYPPERIHLRDQIARHLRERIAEGKWGDYLPSERTLADSLDVSRLTLRAALQALEASKEIRREGRKRKIAKLTATPSVARSDKCTTLVIVSSVPMEEVFFSQVLLLDLLREKLLRHGYEMQTVVSPRFALTRQGSEFGAIVRDNPKAVFLLVRIPPRGQQWFTEHHVPSLVFGSTKLNLPSVDVDFGASCFHAASTLAARKHKRIALIRRAVDLVGDEQSEHGIQRAKERFGFDCLIHRIHGDTATAIDWLRGLRREQRMPTGIIACDPAIALSVYSFCLLEKLTIPDDLAVVCRNDDPLLDALRPKLARYRISDRILLQSLWHGLLPLLRGDISNPKADWITPDFVRGASLGELSVP